MGKSPRSKRSEVGDLVVAALSPWDARNDAELVAVEVSDALDVSVLPPPEAHEVFVGDDAAAKALTYDVPDLAMRGGVMTILTVEGPSEALLNAHDEYERETPERPAGQLLHICAATATGIVVYDVWESQDALAAFIEASPGAPSPVVMGLHTIRAGQA